VAVPPAEAAALYAVDPADFIAARSALAKELKAAGQKDVAAVVAKLRKPSPAAWALNQVARTQPELVTAALAATHALREASDAAVGGDASGFREAAAAERSATRALADEAADLLGPRGVDLRLQLEGTVRAAALDEEVAEELGAGVLTSHHDASGFGFSAATPAPKLRLVAPERRKEDRAKAERKVLELEARAAELATAATAAEATAAAARTAAEQARRRADAAATAASEARAAFDAHT
jgi:hypothetical protein